MAATAIPDRTLICIRQGVSDAQSLCLLARLRRAKDGVSFVANAPSAFATKLTPSGSRRRREPAILAIRAGSPAPFTGRDESDPAHLVFPRSCGVLPLFEQRKRKVVYENSSRVSTHSSCTKTLPPPQRGANGSGTCLERVYADA